jgi:hypothetical protein
MEDGSDRVNELADKFDSLGSDSTSSSDEEDNLPSKEEIAEEFDGVFVKSRKGNVQHLAPENPDSTVCGKDLSEFDEYNASDKYGPFDPLCENCRQNLGVGKETTKTKKELAAELRGEVPEMGSVKEGENSTTIRKRELKAILDYLRELKKQK